MKTILHLTSVRAPREALFRAVTSIDGLAAWWTTQVAGQPSENGLIHFTFEDNFNPDMQVVEHSPPRSVSWTCAGGVKEWADNTFSFHFDDGDGPTTLRFRQDYAAELDDDAYARYNYSWGYYLDSLRLYCETGQGKPFQPAGEQRGVA